MTSSNRSISSFVPFRLRRNATSPHTEKESHIGDLFAFQLAIYTAAGRGEGLTVDAAYLHHLKDSDRRHIPVDTVAVRVSKNRADLLIEGIVGGEFPARPEESKCKGCDMRAICPHAECGTYDL